MVYPSDTGVGPFRTWNAGGFSGKMAKGKADDVSFIGKLLNSTVVKVDEMQVSAHSRRIKIWGNARVVEDDHVLLERLHDPSYPGKVERAILFEIEAWDVNCSQHIRKRFSQKQVAPVIEQLQGRIAELEARLTGMPCAFAFPIAASMF